MRVVMCGDASQAPDPPHDPIAPHGYDVYGDKVASPTSANKDALRIAMKIMKRGPQDEACARKILFLGRSRSSSPAHRTGACG
jgi:hypothetical protein